MSRNPLKTESFQGLVLHGLSNGLDGQLVHLDMGRRGDGVQDTLGYILGMEHAVLDDLPDAVRQDLGVHHAGTDALGIVK